MTNPATNPRFRLAPGVLLGGGKRPPAPHEFRNTSWDRAALAVAVDPVWLLAPLYARDAAGLVPPGTGYPGRLAPPGTAGIVNPAGQQATAAGALTSAAQQAAAADWPTWWAGALAYRPGTPAPRPRDLFAASVALTDLWAAIGDGFQQWCSGRPAGISETDAPAKTVERAALNGFITAHDRDPGRWTVRILQIPVAGDYLHSPEPRRIVISAGLRADPARYAAALAAELPRHF